MSTPASPSYRDRAVLRVACWAVRRLRARGPLPIPFLQAAGLVMEDGGDLYAGTGGLKVLLRAAPRRWAAWRPSTYWSREASPPSQRRVLR